MTHLRRILLLLLVFALLAGCSSGGRPIRRSWTPRNPADIFVDLIDQISGIGDGIARQFRRMTPKW
jgi:hypothetical protein